MDLDLTAMYKAFYKTLRACGMPVTYILMIWSTYHTLYELDEEFKYAWTEKGESLGESRAE